MTKSAASFFFCAVDKYIVLGKAKKGLCMLVRDFEEYLAKVEELTNKNVYEERNYKSNVLQDLTETSNVIFKSLYSEPYIKNKVQFSGKTGDF